MDLEARERVIDSMVQAMLSALKEEKFDYCDLEILKIEDNIRQFRLMIGVVLETASIDAQTVIACFFDKMVGK